MKKKINIGIVCSPWLGGSGVVGSELARYLSKNNKYKVVFIGSDFPFRLDRNEVLFHKVENLKHALFAAPLNEAALIEGIIEAVIVNKLNIIHAHFAIPFGYCAVQAKEILKEMGISIKIVTTLHGTDVLSLGQQVPAIMKYVLEQSDCVTAVSKDLAKKTAKLYHTSINIHVVYNFIDFSIYEKESSNVAIKRKYVKQGEKVFVHISNFRPIKRINDCLKVFSKINKKVPSVLLLIGEGPEINIIKKKSSTLKNQDSIHFIGGVKDPYQYLKIADGLIITSEYESFCLVGLEALVYGVPVFSTNVGGIPEVIKHQKSGYLVKVGDVNSMANYIIEYFNSDKKVEAFQKEAHKTSHKFSANQVVPEYEKIYDKLFSENKRYISNVSVSFATRRNRFNLVHKS